MYMFSTGSRFEQIRGSYMPGPGGLDCKKNTQAKQKLVRNQSGQRTESISKQLMNTNVETNQAYAQTNIRCSKCQQNTGMSKKVKMYNKLEIQAQIGQSQAQSNSETSDALCDICFQKAIDKIYQERQNLDGQIKEIQERIEGNMLSKKIQKIQEEKEQFVISTTGQFIKKTNQDKLNDATYTQIPDISKQTKSYNIFSKDHVQLLGQNSTYCSVQMQSKQNSIIIRNKQSIQSKNFNSISYSGTKKQVAIKNQKIAKSKIQKRLNYEQDIGNDQQEITNIETSKKYEKQTI